MDNSERDEKQVVPDANRKRSSFSSSAPNPARPVRFLISRQRASRGSSNAAFAQEMETVDERRSDPPPTTYGYLEHIRTLKPEFEVEDKSLPKKVREYHEDQLELITSVEDILLPKDDEATGHASAKEKRHKRTVKILTMATLIANIILVIIKIVGAVISRSLSVISSVVDSVVDLMTSVILIWTARKIKNRDVYKYPGGRTRLEPIAVIILSVIMCSASVEVIFESGQTLNQDIQYFEHRHNASSTYELPEINMTALPIIAMVITIVSKTILFVLCYRIKNPTMSALAEDSRNDVASNIVALACGLVAYNAYQNKIKQEAIVVDPIGAICISVYIIIAWILQANRQVRNLTGVTAEPSCLQRLTHVVYNYRPDIVTKIDSIQAVHLGTNLLVEVDIGLPASMPLATAHDIGAELQQQLETIGDVERAFVHLDFEFDHMPACEHKIL